MINRSNARTALALIEHYLDESLALGRSGRRGSDVRKSKLKPPNYCANLSPRSALPDRDAGLFPLYSN